MVQELMVVVQVYMCHLHQHLYCWEVVLLQHVEVLDVRVQMAVTVEVEQQIHLQIIIMVELVELVEPVEAELALESVRLVELEAHQVVKHQGIINMYLVMLIQAIHFQVMMEMLVTKGMQLIQWEH